MPIGTGAVTLQTIPVDPFITDPSGFFSKTIPNKNTIDTRSFTFGQKWDLPMPQVGIIQKLRVELLLNFTVASGGVAPTQRWPHGLVSSVQFAAGGISNLIDVNGIDLHVHRFVKYPAYEEAVDTFPGTVGGGPGGGSVGTISAGTYDALVTFEVPVCHEDGSLVGGIFAQSNQAQLKLHVEIEALANLVADATKVTLNSATAKTEAIVFEIPRDDQTGKMILPDLSRLHGLNTSLDFQFSSTGDVKTPLVRSPGQLHRLFVTGFNGAGATRLQPHPLATSTKRINSIRLVYGGNKTPLTFDPITMLMAESNNFYGSIPPYDRMVFDFIRENPLRDILLLAGVTELNIVPNIDSAVTVSGGLIRTVQETLYAGG